MKLVWLTDIHINFLNVDERSAFYKEIIKIDCDAVLISGDIAEAPSVVKLLTEMVQQINKAIYFVLGNHDYYRGQVAEVKQAMIAAMKTNPLLHWLPALGVHALDDDTILLGQDGWADGRYGDYANSQARLNDSYMIADLFQQKALGKYKLLSKMQELADADAKQLANDLEAAIKCKPKKIIILTHVPPFKESCLYEGKVSNDDYLPYFGSKATGDVLIRTAEANPTTEFLVLCGHTHDKADIKPLHNLNVRVGGAEYYQPEVQEVIFT